MKPTFQLLLVAAGILLSSGCKLPNDGTVDTFGPPYVSSLALSPAVSDIPLRAGSDTALTIERTVDVFAHVRKDTLGLPIASVRCSVTAPDGSVILSDLALHDDGVAPDSIANDGRYAVRCTFRTQRNILGGYVFTVSATDNAGTGSNELAASHILRTKNYFPTLADPVVPDTVVVPTTNQVNAVRLTVAVQDTNGIDDIASVKVSIIRVENGTIAGTYDMFDDGGTTVLQPFGLVSGDITAGDGTYSILFPVANTTNHNMYRDFKFVAIDRSGSESAPKTKRVYFK